MPSNIEIKAKVFDVERLKSTALSLSGADPITIHQEDTFFVVPHGRLKLRKLENAPAQLIYYDRPDSEGPKHSQYHITEVQDSQSLKETLGIALGLIGEVKKTRLLYTVGQTRVHVDNVERLGNYMELEVVMRPEQTMEEGEKIMESLMKSLGISKDNLVSVAYIDILSTLRK